MLSGREFLTKLIAAGVVPVGTRRVVIEADCRNAVRLYSEAFGDDRLWDVDLPDILSGCLTVAIADVPKDEDA